jgi:hypothetical protein
MSDAKQCVNNAIDEWNSESEEDQMSNGEEKMITELAMQFFKKFGYINGNIVLAMISQELN